MDFVEMRCSCWRSCFSQKLLKVSTGVLVMPSSWSLACISRRAFLVKVIARMFSCGIDW